MNDSGLIPVEFTVVVELDPAEQKTKGGIILTTQTVEADEISAQQGVLVAASPVAFDYAEWPEGARRPEVGDRVLFRKYAGGQGGIFKKTINGVERRWRVMNDKDVIAIVEPDAAELSAAA